MLITRSLISALNPAKPRAIDFPHFSRKLIRFVSANSLAAIRGFYSALIHKLRPVKLLIDPRRLSLPSSSCGPAAIRGPHSPPLNIYPLSVPFYSPPPARTRRCPTALVFAWCRMRAASPRDAPQSKLHGEPIESTQFLLLSSPFSFVFKEREPRFLLSRNEVKIFVLLLLLHVATGYRKLNAPSVLLLGRFTTKVC